MLYTCRLIRVHAESAVNELDETERGKAPQTVPMSTNPSPHTYTGIFVHRISEPSVSKINVLCIYIFTNPSYGLHWIAYCRGVCVRTQECKQKIE